MKYKLTMVKDGLFKRFIKKKKEKLQNDTFLIEVDSVTGNRLRKEAKLKGVDANKYLAQLLTQNKK